MTAGFRSFPKADYERTIRKVMGVGRGEGEGEIQKKGCKER